MNPDQFNMTLAVGALEGAWFFGWAIGILLWLVRYLVIELPKTGKIFSKGGEFET